MFSLTLPLAASGPAGTVALPVIVLLYWLPYHARVSTLAREQRTPSQAGARRATPPG